MSAYIWGLLAAGLLFGCAVEIEADPTPTPTHDPDAGAPPRRIGCINAPPQILFGAVAPGAVRTLGVELTGCFDRDVSLISARIEGDDTMFRLQRPPLPIRLNAPSDSALEDRSRAVFLVDCAPSLAGRFAQARLVVDTADSDAPQIQVPLSCQGAWTAAACEPWTLTVNGDPQLTRATQGQPMRLEAVPPPGVSPEGSQVRWQVGRRPADSVQHPSERATAQETDDIDTPWAFFSIDTPGRYELDASISMPEASGCGPSSARLRFELCPCPPTLQVHLEWRTLDDVPARADLDLHLLHPAASSWREDKLDCWAASPSLDWGQPDIAEDDPDLDNDATRAPGVENITLRRLEDLRAIGRRPYRIGVWAGADLEAPVEASIFVRIDGEVVWSRQRPMASGEFWDVGGLSWGPNGVFLVPFDRIQLGQRPTPSQPLAEDAPCLPDSGPACSPPLYCGLETGTDAVGVCRRE